VVRLSREESQLLCKEVHLPEFLHPPVEEVPQRLQEVVRKLVEAASTLDLL